MMSENIKIYKKTEEGYPKTLLQLPDAPSRLYVLGELPDPMRPAIAIVGARNCSSYGKNMAYEYARILTQTGIQVISGLARGVDAAAHAGALAAGGKTYGVMGCGVDFCYPTSSRKLYHIMQQQGGYIRLSSTPGKAQRLGCIFQRQLCQNCKNLLSPGQILERILCDNLKRRQEMPNQEQKEITGWSFWKPEI